MRKKKTVIPDTLETLAREWEGRDPRCWDRHHRLFVEFSRKAVTLGQPMLAFDIAREGLARFPRRRELGYLAALALAKCGATSHAARLLDKLLADGALAAKLRSEALSLAGRIAKDHWAVLGDGPRRRAVGERSRELYSQAYRVARDYFPGINAATMNLLTGHGREARRLAAEVRRRCLAIARGARSSDYWISATVGEACVLLGRRAEACEHYARAAAAAGGNYGDIASMRRQLRLLASTLDLAGDVLEVLKIPRVAAFTGHMIDRPDRRQSRFPPGLEHAVERAIAQALEKTDIGFAYCSAACGADILFIEQMLKRGAEVNIVLPFRREDFVRTSVSFAGSAWVRRFDRVLSRAASVSFGVEEGYLGDDVLHGYASQLIDGMTLLRAQQLEVAPLLVAVADPAGAQPAGGTRFNVEAWRGAGRASLLLDLAKIRAHADLPRKRDAARAARRSAGPAPRRAGGGRRIRTMLFADVAGFSRLREEDAPAFFVSFLGMVAREIRRSDPAPAFFNTWGDGLHLVFDDVRAGADFALRLRDAAQATDWRKLGLAAGTSVRIALHTGPVFTAVDPVIRRRSFFGSHVTRAARIEPVTAPGSVYVSEQTAALLAASGTREFACDYLGMLALAKGYGSGRLYRVRRSGETE